MIATGKTTGMRVAMLVLLAALLAEAGAAIAAPAPCFDRAILDRGEAEVDRALARCFPAGSSLPEAVEALRQAGFRKIPPDVIRHGGEMRGADRLVMRHRRAPGVTDFWALTLVHAPGNDRRILVSGSFLIYQDQNFPARGVPPELARMIGRDFLGPTLLHLVEKPITPESVLFLAQRLGGVARPEKTDGNGLTLTSFLPRRPLPAGHIMAEEFDAYLNWPRDDPDFRFPHVLARWRFRAGDRQFLGMEVTD
ncbi:MAG: hypothetical protein KIT20_14490 [Alphaproteobacteria bacterium]|nr:hypothetical protein [Alphaproteobacteria bacterium]